MITQRTAPMWKGLAWASPPRLSPSERKATPVMESPSAIKTPHELFSLKIKVMMSTTKTG